MTGREDERNVIALLTAVRTNHDDAGRIYRSLSIAEQGCLTIVLVRWMNKAIDWFASNEDISPDELLERIGTELAPDG